MRQVFQSVIVVSLTLGNPCIIFAQGNEAPVGESQVAPLVPYTAQPVGTHDMPRSDERQQEQQHSHMDKFSFSHPYVTHPLNFFEKIFTKKDRDLPLTHADNGGKSQQYTQEERQNTVSAEKKAVNQARPTAEVNDLEKCSLWLDSWMAQMSPEEQAQARHILHEASPRLRVLKESLRDKMRELRTLTYGRETDPQALTMLGQELQQIRLQLGQEFTQMNHQLVKAVGRPLPPPSGRGFRSLYSAMPE